MVTLCDNDVPPLFGEATETPGRLIETTASIKKGGKKSACSRDDTAMVQPVFLHELGFRSTWRITKTVGDAGCLLSYLYVWRRRR